MATLTANEIKRIEKKHPNGISSGAVVEIFKGKGERFSEATLRKYVQLELLPKSKRVGTRGRFKGSSGLYPISVVRQIADIKHALDEGRTLEEIRFGKIGLGGEVRAIKRTVAQAAQVFTKAISLNEDRSRRSALKKALDKQRRQIDREVKELEKLAIKVGRGVRLQ